MIPHGLAGPHTHVLVGGLVGPANLYQEELGPSGASPSAQERFQLTLPRWFVVMGKIFKDDSSSPKTAT